MSRSYCTGELRRASFYLQDQLLKIDDKYHLSEKGKQNLYKYHRNLEKSYTKEALKKSVEETQQFFDILLTNEAPLNSGLDTDVRKIQTQLMHMCQKTTCLCNKIEPEVPFVESTIPPATLREKLDAKFIGNHVFIDKQGNKYFYKHY